VSDSLQEKATGPDRVTPHLVGAMQPIPSIGPHDADHLSPPTRDNFPGVTTGRTGLRSAPLGSSDRVLLVEDNPVNQKVTVAMLEKLGFCTDVVDNGVEAVIAATMVPYRAILMDCEIPVLNGYETTSEIRNQSGASRESPIIAVTSASSELDQQRCLAAGMDGHLTKPLTLGALSAGMVRWAPVAEPTPDPMPERSPAGSHRGQEHDDEPALDAVVLDRLERLGAEAGEDLVGELATLFLADADTRIVALHDALAQLDGPALIHAAHTLCGASANLGAAALARLCARLATDGTVGDLENCEALLHTVEEELARVRTALMAPRPSPVRTDASPVAPTASP
jgi:two-component system sensor histidine kinase/response regulator